MAMTHERLYELTMQALGAAMDEDAIGAANALTEIGETGGANSIYGACCAFAEIGRQALIKFYGGHTPDTSRGEMWAVQQLSDTTDPYDLFAVRFITAYANEDRDQTIALFDASLEAGAEDHVSSVSVLLTTAVQLANSAKG